MQISSVLPTRTVNLQSAKSHSNITGRFDLIYKRPLDRKSLCSLNSLKDTCVTSDKSPPCDKILRSANFISERKHCPGKHKQRILYIKPIGGTNYMWPT